ncbi:MAG: hypothetical protein U1A77_00095 [Pirellulales bacterium]
MTNQPPRDDLTEKANAAFRVAAARVVQRARLTGTPVIVWEDGRIKAIPPELSHLETLPELPTPKP